MNIPKHRHEDVIAVLWQLLTEVEGSVKETDAVGKAMVVSGYNLMNDLGVTDARPRWESK